MAGSTHWREHTLKPYSHQVKYRSGTEWQVRMARILQMLKFQHTYYLLNKTYMKSGFLGCRNWAETLKLVCVQTCRIIVQSKLSQEWHRRIWLGCKGPDDRRNLCHKSIRILELMNKTKLAVQIGDGLGNMTSRWSSRGKIRRKKKLVEGLLKYWIYRERRMFDWKIRNISIEEGNWNKWEKSSGCPWRVQRTRWALRRIGNDWCQNSRRNRLAFFKFKI